MMKLLLCSLLAAQSALAAKLNEFGRSNRNNGALHSRNLEQDAFADEESHVFLEFERYLQHLMSMSLSMSMSYPTGTGGGTGGSGGGGNGSPGTGGGGNGNPSSSGSSAPTISPFPTPTPSGVSSVYAPSSMPSTSPSESSSVAPTLVLDAASLFECSDQGAILAGTRAPVTTPISLTILYEAESTANTTDGFLSELEQALFHIALSAALQCDGNGRRGLNEVTRRLTTSSSVVGSCNVTEGVDNTCFTLESSMAFELNYNVDPDYAAFLSYSALQSAMNNYTGDAIDSVERLDYLAPTPAMPDGSSTPQTQPAGRTYSVLAIGAATAMLAGGAFALYVWVHNRRMRNKRHVQLFEDNNSLSPVSFFSAERGPYEEA